jgi:MFS transporter, SP family, xylose:H+ symportor
MMTAPQPTATQLRFVLVVTFVAALGGLLFGYDTAVISGAIQFLTAHFRLDAAQTGWAASCALVGCIAGCTMAGWIGDSLGRRLLLVISAALFLVSAIGTAASFTFTQFIAFRFLGGIGIGAASIASPIYIAEIAPRRWRGRLVGTNQLAIVSGMLMVYFVNYRIVRLGGDAWNQNVGWRWMFASGAFPAVLLLALLLPLPETPRFLISKGRRAEAMAVVRKIGDEIQALDEIPELDRETHREGWLSFFTPPLRHVILVGIALAVLQQITGINVFLYYAPAIFRSFGNGLSTAMGETVVLGAVNLAFTIIAMIAVDRLGRRPLLIIGALGMGLSLSATGAALLRQTGGSWLLIVVIFYIACFALSLGPVTWILLSEIFPLEIRSRCVAIASIALWAANFLVSQSFPMMTSSAWLLRHFHNSFPFFVYAGFCVVEVVFVWKLIPETKGRSLEEIAQSWSGMQSDHQPAYTVPVSGAEG